MQYILCSRCKFRVPLNKHVCTTCGLTIPPLHAPKAVPDELGPKVQKNTFWRTFLGLSAPVEEKPGEPAAEEPAMS
jgi:hypothetical protein